MDKVSPEHWFAARTRFRQELKTRQRLASFGIDSYIPTRLVKSSRTGQETEKSVISGLIFLHTTKERALSIVNDYGVPIKYLIDRTKERHSIMVIPDKHMEDFIRVVAEGKKNEDDCLVTKPLKVGDRVRVINGSLKQVEGNVLDSADGKYLVVGLCGILQAKIRILPEYLEKIEGSVGDNR